MVSWEASQKASWQVSRAITWYIFGVCHLRCPQRSLPRSCFLSLKMSHKHGKVQPVFSQKTIRPHRASAVVNTILRGFVLGGPPTGLLGRLAKGLLGVCSRGFLRGLPRGPIVERQQHKDQSVELFDDGLPRGLPTYILRCRCFLWWFHDSVCLDVSFVVSSEVNWEVLWWGCFLHVENTKLFENKIGYLQSVFSKRRSGQTGQTTLWILFWEVCREVSRKVSRDVSQSVYLYLDRCFAFVGHSNIEVSLRLPTRNSCGKFNDGVGWVSIEHRRQSLALHVVSQLAAS